VLIKDDKKQQVVFQDHVDLTQKYLDIQTLVKKAKQAVHFDYQAVRKADVIQE
jgi:hypothetical protein